MASVGRHQHHYGRDDRRHKDREKQAQSSHPRRATRTLSRDGGR